MFMMGLLPKRRLGIDRMPVASKFAAFCGHAAQTADNGNHATTLGPGTSKPAPVFSTALFPQP
jgi:hypothetical protein